MPVAAIPKDKCKNLKAQLVEGYLRNSPAEKPHPTPERNCWRC
ncbi:MAG: hypothetical protein ACFB2X_24725 [Rivularia sp. (in: cyanobacteria)]